MAHDSFDQSPILRLFQVRTRRGAAEELLAKFATTSADVVRNEPGNEGYFFGRGVAMDEDIVVFASLWKDLEAIKQRFGDDWQKSHLPTGYDAMIDECSVRHIDLSSGWHVQLDN